MMLFGCLVTLAIACVSYEIGIHLSEEAEGIIVLALIGCILFGFLSLILLPWYLKSAVLLILLVSKLYFPSSTIRQ
jgi:hypothetical protein